MSEAVDIETYRKLYPDQFPSPTFETVIFYLFILALPFLIPYIYIRIFESWRFSSIRRATETCGRRYFRRRHRLLHGLVYKKGNRTINGNATIGRLINLIDRVLKIQIFNPKIKI